MSPFLRRLAPRLVPAAPLCLAILVAILTATPAQAHASDVPHLIHEYEGWVALAVVVLALVGAGVLLRRSLRR
ncbi:hypothetical protein [Massilia niabensis]|uniref:Uncharacterized protein n=1 Tax=Massilia niabensis TaxID=544910 RepID=A0ABW0L486_9BURK